jgi:hypothetical protein
MGLASSLEAVRKDGDVFVLETEDSQIIFRLPPLRRAMQYAHILAAAETIDLKFIVFEYIFRDVIEDKVFSIDQDIPAGIPETIAKLVLFLSGVDDSYYDYTENLLEFNRDSSGSAITTMKRIICSTFSGYKFSDLELLNYQELVYIFVQAEKVLLEQGIITEGLRLKKPGEEKEEPVVSIGEMIKQDASAYNEFDAPDVQRRPKVDPAEKAKEEERKFREQVLNRYQRKGG